MAEGKTNLKIKQKLSYPGMWKIKNTIEQTRYKNKTKIKKINHSNTVIRNKRMAIRCKTVRIELSILFGIRTAVSDIISRKSISHSSLYSHNLFRDCFIIIIIIVQIILTKWFVSSYWKNIRNVKIYYRKGWVWKEGGK